MENAMSPELDFLVRAANYGGSDFSQAARNAVDAIAERMRVLADMQLKVANERLKDVSPTEIAERAEAQGLPIS